jgi:hypothetical protein
MKKVLLGLLIIALVPFRMHAEWVPLTQNRTAPAPPSVSLLSDDNNSTVIRIELSGFDLKEFYSDGKKYNLVDLLSEATTSAPGYPELPCIAKILAVPDQAGISVEVIETGEVRTFKDIDIPPVRQSWLEGELEPAYSEYPRAYNTGEIFPAEYVKIDPPAVFRDFRIVRVSVFPIRYNPAGREIQVVSSITVRISYGKGEAVNPKTTPKKKIAPSFGKIYRSSIFNYQEVLDRQYGGREDGRDLILCIMPDEFTASFQVYADWKRQSGTDVHVTKFSDIGANASNPDIIKEHITDAYHNWDNPPTYVLMVGDDGVFPKKIVTYPDYSFPNEDYFVEIDGNDYFPELMIGRFTNQGDYRMQVMITKLLSYEKEPYVNDTTWFRKGTCCSNNAYASQVYTKRFTYHEMKDNGNFLQVDTLMSDGDYWGGDCSVDIGDVISAINNGRSYLNYRGEGWYDGWQASCYYFSTNDVSSLNNGPKYTFVTSIGCGVAGFQASGGNCFGEEWMESGTLLSQRGAAAFIGPTSNTHTTYNNHIDKGIYIGMFEEGMDTPGQALVRGKLYMYEVFGNEYYVEYHYKIYCILGDPSIHIWKNVPKHVNAIFPQTIPVADNQVEFQVAFTDTGQPVANAEVCVTGDEIFATGITDSTGTVIINIIAESEDTLMVTIRGGNVIPFQAPMEVIQYEILVEPEKDPIVVDLDGNLNGMINPNEHCSIDFTLKNWGILTANNVMATLTSGDPELVEVITTNPVSFGNIPSYGTATGDAFQFYVLPDCPADQVITLQLHITCGTLAWDYDEEEDVTGCRLDYKNFAVFDASSPNMNFKMDPGETVVVVLSIKNTGLDIAPDVTGILRCNNPYITITDSIGYFETLEINGQSVNMEDYFMLSIDATCPTDYMVNYSLKASTQNGNYPYSTLLDFQMPVSKSILPEFTGPDAYGYYAYTNDDSFYDQTPVYEWHELEGTGTQIALPLISEYTKTVDLPFTFKYYGLEYQQLRISTDGWMAFGSGTQTAPQNTMLPHLDNVNNMVAVFWDDLYDNEFFFGNILYYNDAINHRFIVEWDSISHNHFTDEPLQESFQAILLDPAYYPTTTGDGNIIVQYRKVEVPESVTVGIENNTQDIGLQYVFNQFYDPTASPLKAGKAIKFTTEPPFAYILTSVDKGQPGSDNPLNGKFRLQQNRPNPFTEKTWITYSLPVACHATVSIFTILGEPVCTLFNGNQSAGTYTVGMDGASSSGTRLSPGIYLYRLQTESCSETRKMFLVR